MWMKAALWVASLWSLSVGENCHSRGQPQGGVDPTKKIADIQILNSLS